MILLSNIFDDNFLFFKLLVLKLFGFVVYEYEFKSLFLDEYKYFEKILMDLILYYKKFCLLGI